MNICIRKRIVSISTRINTNPILKFTFHPMFKEIFLNKKDKLRIFLCKIFRNFIQRIRKKTIKIYIIFFIKRRSRFSQLTKLKKNSMLNFIFFYRFNTIFRCYFLLFFLSIKIIYKIIVLTNFFFRKNCFINIFS